MLTNLKEKAGELKSKEMELAEREKAVSRRQASISQILDCPNCKRCKSCHQSIQTEVYNPSQRCFTFNSLSGALSYCLFWCQNRYILYGIIVNNYRVCSDTDYTCDMSLFLDMYLYKRVQSSGIPSLFKF